MVTFTNCNGDIVSREQYTAESIEVLTGLDPVKRRPGMYTDTSRPNHLAQEAIDNSVDEALAGYADTIEVCAYADWFGPKSPTTAVGCRSTFIKAKKFQG